ncbi:MAG: S41 family peptidase [Bacteroidetes bacterium]|nr:S41 family peptidase [Bacteroidota bacterium]
MPRKLLLPLTALMLVVTGMLVGFNLKIETPNKRAILKIEEVMNKVSDNYFEETDPDKMAEDAIKGMLNGLDPHTFYIPPVEMKSVNESMQGAFEGIGIEFNILDDTLYVVSPISGGPSERVGILAGDRIVEVDGEKIAGVGLTNNEVVKKLRGAKDTKVVVKIKRSGKKELLSFEIIRDKIPLHSVDYSYMIDDATGYIKVNRFSETTVREFIEHLTKLKQQGLKNLILDLRNNPGGYLQQATLMADFFLKQGQLITYTEGRIASSKTRHEATNRISDFEQGGLVILINQGSASASEIVSGAVQDHDRGLIVGRRSFGKGLVQQQYMLADGSAIRVVISRYFTPSGRCIQKPYDKNSKDYDMEIAERYENGEIFDESKIQKVDSLKFKTQSGRVVYGGGGILPDVFVPGDTTETSDYLTNLIMKRVFAQFGYKFKEQNPAFASQYKDGFDFARRFEVDKDLLTKFTTFGAEHEVPYVQKDYIRSEKFIRNNIKAAIGRALWGDDGYYPVVMQVDDVFQKGYGLMPEAVKLEKTGKFTAK